MQNDMVIKEINMGFWDTAGKVAKGAAEGMIEQSKEMREILDRLNTYSDDKLISIVQDDSLFGGPSGKEKSFAKNILAKRGINI